MIREEIDDIIFKAQMEQGEPSKYTRQVFGIVAKNMVELADDQTVELLSEEEHCDIGAAAQKRYKHEGRKSPRRKFYHYAIEETEKALASKMIEGGWRKVRK